MFNKQTISIDQPWRQPRVAFPLKKLQPTLANLFLQVLQLTPQLERPPYNNESKNNNRSSLSLFALEEEYVKLIEVEAVFLLDINDNNIYFFVLQYQSYMNSVIEGLKYIYRCFRLFALEKKSRIFAIDNCFIYIRITGYF